VIKVTFTGAKVFYNKLERASNQRMDDIMKTLDDEAKMIEMRSLRDVPIYEQELMRSQYVKQSGTSTMREHEIGFTAKHAAYKEFGTGPGLNLSGEYGEFSDYANKFKTTNFPSNNTRQKKYLISAFILARRAFDRKAKTIMKNILK